MKLKICGDIKHPPYEFINHKGEIDGFNVDITREICKNQNIDYSIDLLNWEEALQDFNNEKYDAIQGKSIDKSKKEYIFPIKYLETVHVFYTTRDNFKKYTFKELLSKRIGVQSGDMNEGLFNVIREENNGIMKKFPSHEEVIDSLLKGEIDIAIGNKNTVIYYFQIKERMGIVKFVGPTIASTAYSIAFKDKNKDIAKKFEDGMKNIKKEGIYSRLYDKWFGKRINDYEHNVIENLETGIIFMGCTGRVVNMNKSAKKFLNVNESDYNDIERKDLENIINFDIIEKISRGESANIYEKKCYEDEIILGISYSPYINGNGEITGILINIKDITLEENIKERLQTKDKLESVGKMLLSFAHEIRNPLTSINNFINLIPDNINDPEFVDALLKFVPEQIQFINKLLEELLNYSKPSIGSRESVNLKSELLDMINILKINHNFVYSMSLDKNINVYIDKGQLTQILYNIFTNALEASDNFNEKELTITGYEDSQYVILKIRDYGEGIKREYKNKIFDPFFSTKEKGTGLGLYIVYNIMESNDGELIIDSLKDGTLVTLKFRKKEG